MADVDEKGGKSKKTRGVVDRIEDGGMAVVYLGEDEKSSIDLPTSMLPSGTAGGDHVTITVTADAESKQKTGERLEAMRKRLKKMGGEDARKDFKL